MEMNKDALIELLQKAAGWFRKYEAEHMEKRSYIKAETNRVRAVELEAGIVALTAAHLGEVPRGGDGLIERLKAAIARVGPMIGPVDEDIALLVVAGTEASTALAAKDTEIARLKLGEVPLDMVLPCPKCGHVHVDAPEPESDWTNPPHKSHLCAKCGTIWRPADIATNGVAETKTRGKADTYPAAPSPLGEKP